MDRIDPSALPRVLDPAIVSTLCDELAYLGSTVWTSFDSASARWRALREVFDVHGAEGIHLVLDRPRDAAAEFAESLARAQAVLWEAAAVLLPELRSARASLAARIDLVNADVDAAEARYAAADAAYWSLRGGDAESEAADHAHACRVGAAATRTRSYDAAIVLRDEIERFRDRVETEEHLIASRLNAIVGGEQVLGAWGRPVRTSQSMWGVAGVPYPGAPPAASSRTTLAEHLQSVLSRAVISRIRWLAEADRRAVRDWIAAHPDFASAVGLVDPARAAGLWAMLAGASESLGGRAGRPGRWASGPLAQLFALAPLAVGNLNGVPAVQRNLFAREGLAQLLAGDRLDADARDKLMKLQDMVKHDPDVVLLSVFLDLDGAPRASIAWGDIDSAHQVTTLSHGIETDLGALGEWATSAKLVRRALADQMRHAADDSNAAIVLFLEWDSGGASTVHGTDRSDAGAARFAQLLAGFAQTNPAAQRNVVLHSLGTTMAAQAIADHPGLVDHAWFLGSAGITEKSADALARQIRSGQLVVHAAHASTDWVAPLGRVEALGSAHPVDPRTVAGVREMRADGGFVAEYGERGAMGVPVGGHNAQRSTDPLFWRVQDVVPTPRGTVAPVFDTESTGYLDDGAESFLRLVVGLADAAALVEAE
jgi:hypothetical protein